MSNTLAIGMVTAALRRILAEAVAAVPAGGVLNARVSTRRPDLLSDADGAGINVFLYQVATNPGWSGAALPSRRADGTVTARPEQALDLHYLLTFLGDEDAQEPQRLLGAAATTLVAAPVLSRERVRDLAAKARADDPATWTQFSDLADQVDVVRFSPFAISIEELSRLWATFVQAPYRLSVTYQASVVLLDADLTPEPPLPVLSRGIDAAALAIPSITRAVTDSAPGGPVGPGTVLRIEGERLQGTVTRIRLGDLDLPVPPGGNGGTVLRVAVPATVRAGLNSLQVHHPRLIGTPPVERAGAESNAVPVIIRPILTAAVSTAPGDDGGVLVSVPVAPAVGREQRVQLLLNEHRPPPSRAARAYAFSRPVPDPGAPEASTTVVVPVPAHGVSPGTYLVRVQVDGAQSLLTPGADGQFDGPRTVFG